MPERAVFSIGSVARLLGIPVATIRTWENRYQAVMPERSPGGQRLFTREQVEQLRHVKELLDAGLTPADAHRVLAEELGGASGAPAAPRASSSWRESSGAAWTSVPDDETAERTRPT